MIWEYLIENYEKSPIKDEVPFNEITEPIINLKGEPIYHFNPKTRTLAVSMSPEDLEYVLESVEFKPKAQGLMERIWESITQTPGISIIARVPGTTAVYSFHYVKKIESMSTDNYVMRIERL